MNSSAESVKLDETHKDTNTKNNDDAVTKRPSIQEDDKNLVDSLKSLKINDDDNDDVSVPKEPAKQDDDKNAIKLLKKVEDELKSPKKADNVDVPKSSIKSLSDYDDDEIIMPDYEGHFVASEIAGLIGKNQYVTKHQALYKLLKKDKIFSYLIEQIKKETNNKKEMLVNVYLRQVSRNLETIIDESSDKVENVDVFNKFIDDEIEKAMQGLKITDDLTEDVKIRIRKGIRTRIQTGRGAKLEQKSLNKFETDSKISITGRNSTLYRQKYELYSIGGRVDGIDSKQECVIEIKNRVKYVDTVPEYDVVQCVIYMRLTGMKKCILVECFPDGQRRETNIEWDQEEFERIDKLLRNLVLEIRSLTKARVAEIIKKNDEDEAK